jgi:hypothetical protein
MANIHKLNAFYSMLTQVPLRLAHQFQVTIVRPGLEEMMLGGDKSATVKVPFTFMASATNIPAPTMKENAIHYHGIDFVVPAVLNFDHKWSITVLVDADLKIRENLEAWLAEFSDLSKSGGGSKVIPKYSANIDLFDQHLEKIVKSYHIVGIFPTDVGKLEFDQSSEKNITTTLNITYQYLYPFSGEGDSAPNKDPLKIAGGS